MFTLHRTITRNAKTDTEDTAAVKFALTALGYYDDGETGLSPYGDDRLFHSIKTFQKDHDLKVDGVMKPDGPTQEKMNEKLKSDVKSGSAFGDFWRNYQDMRTVKLDGADKYFHCKANYEATERGWLGGFTAYGLSEIREYYGQFIKGDSIKDKIEDQEANKHGRKEAKSGKFSSAREACALYRPEGLDEKY